jgi:hypothetical protein
MFDVPTEIESKFLFCSIRFSYVATQMKIIAEIWKRILSLLLLIKDLQIIRKTKNSKKVNT